MYTFDGRGRIPVRWAGRGAIVPTIASRTAPRADTECPPIATDRGVHKESTRGMANNAENERT